MKGQYPHADLSAPAFRIGMCIESGGVMTSKEG